MEAKHGVAVACALLAATIVTTPPVAAQSDAPVINESQRQCLCRQRQIELGRREIDLQSAMLEERESELVSLTQQIDATRPLVNPNDLAAIESFKRLLERQQGLRAYVQRELRPGYAAYVAKFNEVVGAFNQMCAGGVPKTVPANLECSDFPAHHMKSR